MELYTYELKREWIPVSERLPIHEGTYMVFSKEHGVDIRYRDGYGFVGAYKEPSGDDITHWMPIPAGPGESTN
jgi:hypothetical protein